MKLLTLFQSLLLTLVISFFLPSEMYGYSGCTDSLACNYDPGATVDDGSCIYSMLTLIAQPDSLCVQDGEFFNFNVLDNDIFCNGAQLTVTDLSNDPCFFIDLQGNVYANPDTQADCCGEHTLTYMACTQGGEACGETTFSLTVKCPKPDCSLIDLSDYMDGGPVGLGLGGCLSVCENSVSTLFVPYNPSLTYSWNIIGGAFTAGSNNAEIIVSWGSAGSGSVILNTQDGNGNIASYIICVDIMTAPTASFSSPGYVCLGHDICFTNNSTNEDAYYWDFGDGGSSTMEDPCYTYNLPGTYTVTLHAINFNYDSNGNPLCCCTDTFSMDVIVDPLPGPNIYWISTLCEGDSSKYWTDASNCSSYVWTVLDANNMPIPFIGQGNDTICVSWAAGPSATITLDVTNCDDAYCTSPTTVTVPIIPATTTIDGPIEVCENETAVYTLPKWLGTTYLWNVVGGVLVSGDSTHTATIQWGAAGTGHIHVDYYNEFLAGLPGHAYPDCYGTADLDVLIKPKFELLNSGASTVCVGDVSNIFATGTPTPLCNWTITPAVTFTDNGDNISVSWTAPGTYVIEATPIDPNIYCNTSQSLVIQVFDLPPPTAIGGPLEICPGDTYYYTASSTESGVNFYWSATNGTLSNSTGTTIGVTWGLTGPYTLNVYQQSQSAPGCSSAPISITVNPKLLQGPMVITGNAACTNSLSTYILSPTQHPDAVITWSITPTTGGSVVNGQGTDTADVQWNNDAGSVTVTAQVSLCGDTVWITLPDVLFSPVVPTITQTGTLCPGGNVTLNTAPTFSTYSWSTGSNTSSTNISTAGIYSVTTTDSNNCSATTYYEVNAVPGPTAEISSGDNPVICIPSPHTVTLVAATNPNLEFEWFCNSVSQGPASPASTFVHPFSGVAGSYSYYVIVTDITTGCTNQSLSFVVTESECLPGGCTPEPYILSIGAVKQFPTCNAVDFTLTSFNFTLSNWSFGDGAFSTAINPTHTYTEAGCYNVTVTGTVPELGGIGNCAASADTSICVPLAAEFDFDYITCKDVQFNDFSTYIVGTGNAISNWMWTSTAGTSTSPNPLFSFPGSGTYPVTLTVTNSNGCVASITHNVVINSVGIPTITASPNPLCAGVPLSFTAPATNAVSWFWDFGDLSTFDGPAPQHTYLNGGNYTVTVTVEDNQGCTETVSLVITVFPGIPPGSITTNPGLTICAGSTTTLSAPFGYSYLWSNSATAQNIVVGAGTYSVLLTDGNGCTLELDPVTVVELPLPDASISGNLFICDSGCTLLNAPYGSGWTYQWMDNGVPISGAIFNQYYVCDFNLGGPYTVEVTDQNGCRNTSLPVTVAVAPSPAFTLTVTPDFCAGTPSTITVTPVEPNVSYSWNTGDTGTTLVTSQEGTYTVVGTNDLTGCSSSASTVIHPVPDLCAVPVGCYQVCNPDTICGPPGLTSYQWSMNGSPILTGTGPCLEVTASGTYNLTATNEWGCSATSDSLYLEVINCDSMSCDFVGIDFSYLIDPVGTVDSCCVSLNYTNNYGGDIKGLNIHTLDADLNWDLGSIDPNLSVQSISTSDISLAHLIAGTPLPSGVVTGFIDFCISNVINSPQTIIIDWYDFTDLVICSDTIMLACPPEPDCLYMQSDSIYCQNNQTFYQFTVCNPAASTYNIGYISINPVSPAGIVLTPPNIDITGTPIAPGNCQTFTIQLSGPNLGGQSFCYNLIGHEFNPDLDPSTLCCSLDTLYCIDIPFCDPCDLVSIQSVLPTTDLGCCYQIILNNGFDANYFDEIGVCVISPATTMTVNNPFGSGWITGSYTTTTAGFNPDGTTGGFVPLGSVALPEICIDTQTAPNQQLEIKWMNGGTVVCRDTIEVFCEPPCGYLLNEMIGCNNTDWTYSATVKNTASYAVQQAAITFADPLLSAYNTNISLGNLLPGATFGPISWIIGAPAQAGDTVCFTVTLHEVDATGLFLSCCNFTHCVVLPDCGFVSPCLCDDTFILAVDAGINCAVSGSNPNAVTFSMAQLGYFSECDQLQWHWGDGSAPTTGYGPDQITHIFPGAGGYKVCVKVMRLDDNGEECSWKHCKWVDIAAPAVPPLTIYPNPTSGIFKFQFSETPVDGVYLTISDYTQRPIIQRSYFDITSNTEFIIDLSNRSKGVYFLTFRVGEDIEVKKVIVY